MFAVQTTVQEKGLREGKGYFRVYPGSFWQESVPLCGSFFVFQRQAASQSASNTQNYVLFWSDTRNLAGNIHY